MHFSNKNTPNYMNSQEKTTSLASPFPISRTFGVLPNDRGAVSDRSVIGEVSKI